MAGRKSKDKGADFERLVAKMFANVYGMLFRRTPLSGGWAKDADVAAGDLVCVDDPDFGYCVECKKEEGWCLESLFTDKHAWFDAWWKQLVEECPEDKEPLLVFSRNYMPIFVAVRSAAIYGFSFQFLFLHHESEEQAIVVALLEDFLEWDTENVDDWTTV